MYRFITLILACGTLMALPVVGQIPARYEIVDVTHSPKYEAFPRINNHGHVVFEAWIPGDNQSGEIFLYDSGNLIQLTDDNVHDLIPDINDRGTIVWSRAIGPIDPSTGEPTYEIVVYRDGQLTQLTHNAINDLSPKINKHGLVAWDNQDDIFLFDGSRIAQITESNQDSWNYAAEMNDRGEIVWRRWRRTFDRQVMLYSDGEIRELTTGDTTEITRNINNRGQVVWSTYDRIARYPVIKLWDSGVTTVLIEDAEDPVINDRGDVAFQRWNPVDQAWNAWLYRSSRFFQLTDDDRDDNVPDINNRCEVVWSSAHILHGDIRFLRRIRGNEAAQNWNTVGRFRD